MCYIIFNMRRKPLSLEDQDYLNDLFKDYKEAREQQHEYEKDAKEIAQQIIELFDAHGIKEKKSNTLRKLFYIRELISYKYSVTDLKRLRQKKSTKRKETRALYMSEKKYNIFDGN